MAASSTDKHGVALIEWIRLKGGYVTEHIKICQVDPKDPSSRYGTFAKERILATMDLLIIPHDCCITMGDSGNMCDMTPNLIKELKLGEKSKFAPYVNYLNEQPCGQASCPVIGLMLESSSCNFS